MSNCTVFNFTEITTFTKFLLSQMSFYDDPENQVVPPPMVGYCAPYNGRICGRVLNSTSLVWYNSSSGSGEGLFNERVSEKLWVELISLLQEPCRSAAEVMLCHYAFPNCAWDDIYPVGLPLCYEDCVAVKESFCFDEWRMVEENKRRGVYVEGRAHFRLPVCTDLPSSQDSSANGKLCTSAGLTEIKQDLVTTDCMKGKGRFYQGDLSETKSGLTCKHWDTESRPPVVFDELKNAENKCRNAGGEKEKPWCYTNNHTIPWELCHIPYCEGETFESIDYYGGRTGGVDLLPPSRTISSSVVQAVIKLPPVFLIACGIVVGIFLLCFLIALCCVFRKSGGGKKSRLRTSPSGNLGLAPPDESELEKLPVNTSYHYTGNRLNPQLEALEYNRNDIIYIRDLGQGMFGRVFQARAPGLDTHEEFSIVAVKALKEEAGPDLSANFEKEACLLAEFDHPNIVRLLAVCAIGKPMCLLLEYMGRGDLNRFLRSSAPANYVGTGSFSEVCLNHSDKVFIAKQVAAGMVYLSERGFVHRDLATRNCLVSDNMEVKISDFGLSERLSTENGSYKGRPQDAIPVRWMPLESITTNEFTLKSDVWAFGICLWEVFTFGMQPYYGMSHEEVIDFLRSGNRLAPPENCPPSIYELMMKCWCPVPAERPGFRVIFGTLELIQGELEKLMAALRRNGSMGSIRGEGVY